MAIEGQRPPPYVDLLDIRSLDRWQELRGYLDHAPGMLLGKFVIRKAIRASLQPFRMSLVGGYT
jgi:hypothetical protein